MTQQIPEFVESYMNFTFSFEWGDGGPSLREGRGGAREEVWLQVLSPFLKSPPMMSVLLAGPSTTHLKSHFYAV